MKTYYMHISYMAVVKGQTLTGDCLYKYRGNRNLANVREDLKKSCLALCDMDGLPSIISIDIIPKRLFKRLWGEQDAQ